MSGRSLLLTSGTSMSGISQITPTSITASMTIYSLMTSILKTISATYEPIRSPHLHPSGYIAGDIFLPSNQSIIRQMKITLHHQTFTLKAGTKTVYELESEETKEVTSEQHKNAVDAAPWFRRLGGSETLTREYTKRGYQVTQIVSKSPDRQTKVIRKYSFQ